MTDRPPPLAPRNPKLPDMIERNPWEAGEPEVETMERQEVVRPPAPNHDPPRKTKGGLLSKWRWRA